jgi:hypothetical protein
VLPLFSAISAKKQYTAKMRDRHRKSPQGRSIFRLFNPEPTATAANPKKNTVAVGSGLNDPLPILIN